MEQVSVLLRDPLDQIGLVQSGGVESDAIRRQGGCVGSGNGTAKGRFAGITQLFNQLGFEVAGNAVFQAVGFDVGAVQIHSQQTHHQPLGEAVPAGNVLAPIHPLFSQADALVGTDVDQPLLLHPAGHSGY